MRLSRKQSEVIRLMREGHAMYKNVTYVTIIFGNGCSVATFFSLLNKHLIEKHRLVKDFGMEYRLTKLGKKVSGPIPTLCSIIFNLLFSD